MGTKTIIAFVAVCLAVLVVCSVILGSLVYQGLINFEKSAATKPLPATPVMQQPVQIIPQPSPLNEGGNGPYVVTSHLYVTDNRIIQPYSLQVNGWLNNTGDGTAYNLFVHVVAFSKEGLVMNNYINERGITPHASLGLGFSLDYSGAAIVNCSVTPVYSDSLMQTSNITLP